MDRQNLKDCQRIAPTPRRAELQLFLKYAPECGYEEVPDPYSGAAADFERVLDLADSACRGLLAYCREHSGAGSGAPMANRS